MVEIGTVNPLKRPTIRDVAAAAGVSKSLVSLAFREPERVAEASLKLILEASDKLGYVPNLSAQSLSSHHAPFVGVVVVDLANPLQTDLADRVRSELAARDVFALMTTAAPKHRHADYASQVKQTLSAIRDLRPKGLIVVGTLLDMDALMQVSAASRVCVVSAIPSTDAQVHVVRVDDSAGARLALDEFVGLGVSKLVFIGGAGGAVSQARARAFLEQVAGRAELTGRVQEAEYGYEAGLLSGRAVISSGEAVDGILVHNDQTAFGVQAAYLEAKTAMPHLISFDNIAMAGFPQLAVTSLDQHNGAIAAEAVRWLESDEPPAEVLITPTLIRR